MTTATTTRRRQDPAAELEAARADLADAIEAADAAPSLAERLLAEPAVAAAQAAVDEAERTIAAQEAEEAAATARAPIREAEAAWQAAKAATARALEARNALAKPGDPALAGAHAAAFDLLEGRFAAALDAEAEAAETLRVARGGAPAPPPAEEPPSPLEAAEEALGRLLDEETQLRAELDAAKAEGRARSGPDGLTVIGRRYSKVMERRLQAEHRVDELNATTAQEPTHADAGAADWSALEAAARETIAGDAETVYRTLRGMLAGLDSIDQRLVDRRAEMARLRGEAQAGGHPGWKPVGWQPPSVASPRTWAHTRGLIAELARAWRPPGRS